MDQIINNAGFSFKKENNLYKLSIKIGEYIHKLSIIVKKDNLLVSTHSGYFYITIDKLSQVLNHLKKDWIKEM